MTERVQKIIAVQSFTRRHPDSLSNIPKPLRGVASRLTERPSTQNSAQWGSYLSESRAEEIIEELTNDDYTAVNGNRYQRRAVIIKDKSGLIDF